MSSESSPVVPYWHFWTDADGISHQSRCELTDFHKAPIHPVAAPRWIGAEMRHDATVFVTILPVGWIGDWHENPRPQWIFLCPIVGSSSRWMVFASKWVQARFRLVRIRTPAVQWHRWRRLLCGWLRHDDTNIWFRAWTAARIPRRLSQIHDRPNLESVLIALPSSSRAPRYSALVWSVPSAGWLESSQLPPRARMKVVAAPSWKILFKPPPSGSCGAARLTDAPQALAHNNMKMHGPSGHFIRAELSRFFGRVSNGCVARTVLGCIRPIQVSGGQPEKELHP